MLKRGTILGGRYEILAPVGAGGMGEVYQARDRVLSREVAVKMIPQQLVENRNALTRFQREAKTLASLSHPNILTIYDFGLENATHFLVAELLKGETLRASVKQSPIPIRRSLEIAIAIAEGLSAAHANGIIHRDLKPENIFLKSDGSVKILDFGLARLHPSVSPDDLTSAPTASHQTEANVVLGTVPYMSPEQVRGEPVDARSDIFSFGSVLYEMLTRKRAFLRETNPETMTAILKEEPPPVSTIFAEVPPELERIVSHCLEKNPENRFQSSHDLAFALKALLIGSTQIRALAAKPKTKIVSALFVPLFILFLVAGFYWIKSQKVPTKIREKSIAVLPFTNLSDSKEDEYFSDGITEDVIAQLSKISDLKVISRTSVMSYKDDNKPLRQIAKELRVAVVLEGSVRRAGNRIRIVSQLIDAETDDHIWAETYDRELKDVFEIQSDVAQQIAGALKAKLMPAEKGQIEKQPTTNLAAYDYYLKGRQQEYQMSKQSVEKAIASYQKALEIDPNFALAYAGLGDAYSSKVFYGAPDTWFDTAAETAQKALAIDRNLAEGYEALGYAYHFKGLHSEAIENLKKALELKPNYARAAAVLAKIYWLSGRLDKALPWAKKAVDLDPRAFVTYRYVGNVYHWLGDLDKAEAWYDKGLQINPKYIESLYWKMYISIERGNFSEARKLMEKILAIDSKTPQGLFPAANFYLGSGDFPRAEEYLSRIFHEHNWYSVELAYCYWKQQKYESARKQLEMLRQEYEGAIKSGGEIQSMDYVRCLAIQGKKKEALQLLATAIDQGYIRYAFLLEKEPFLEDLRDEPKFQELVVRVNSRVQEMRKRIGDS